MIAARAPRRPRGFSPGGFTLLEIILALALIGLLSAVLIGGSARLLGGSTPTPTEVFWKTVSAARKTALENGRDVRLSFDIKERGFALADGAMLKTFPIPPPAPGSAAAALRGDLAVDFLSGQKTGTSIILAGQVVETQPLPYVTFYSDGTCSPFRAQFRLGVNAHIVAIDPWTCAAVLTPADAASKF